MKDIPVLFENDFCLVLNKPYGLAVQGGQGIKNSLDSILSQNFSPRPFLVHRLDRDTSGVIVVAKTKEAARFFSALFAGAEAGKNNFSRQYIGVCKGVLTSENGVIKLSLDVNGKEKESQTLYRVLSVEAAGRTPFSLLELELCTGRMHQIRRHLAKIGHPLLGDDKYGDFSLNKTLRKTHALKRLLLHASRLIIPDSSVLPGGLDITAPTPEHFSAFI